MRIEIGKVSPEAEAKLPGKQSDGSRIGVNFIDVIIKSIKAHLEDGGKVSCKRRGLQLTLTVGDKKGEGLMRRLEYGPEPENILKEALKEAAEAAEVGLVVEDRTFFLEVP